MSIQELSYRIKNFNFTVDSVFPADADYAECDKISQQISVQKFNIISDLIYENFGDLHLYESDYSAGVGNIYLQLEDI